MANNSAQPSPTKLAPEPFDEKLESPILPPQQQQREQEPSRQPSPVRPLSLDTMEEAKPQQGGSRALVKTPEPRASKERINSHKEMADRSPSTPGHLAPFDWDEFEARFEEALAKANEGEQELLDEFESLIKYFNVWASAASVHDTERGIKRLVLSSPLLRQVLRLDSSTNGMRRLQTRERYVKIAEQSLSQKKKHRESHRIASLVPRHSLTSRQSPRLFELSKAL